MVSSSPTKFQEINDPEVEKVRQTCQLVTVSVISGVFLGAGFVFM